MELYQLEYFLEAARQRSFTRAAERLNLAQAALSEQMRKLEAVEVAPGGEVALAPGGKHLMLIGPKHAFAAGDSIEVVLQVCDGQQQTVSLPVREAAPATDSEHAQHSP